MCLLGCIPISQHGLRDWVSPSVTCPPPPPRAVRVQWTGRQDHEGGLAGGHGMRPEAGWASRSGWMGPRGPDGRRRELMLGPAGAGPGLALHADQPAEMDGALLSPPELAASQPGSGVLLRGRLLALASNGCFTGDCGSGGGHDFLQIIGHRDLDQPSSRAMLPPRSSRCLLSAHCMPGTGQGAGSVSPHLSS